MKIALSDITLDPETQPRAELDSLRIAEFAEDMRQRAAFPPVTIYQQDGSMWLADGWHRYYARKQAGFEDIEAEVKPGDKRAAVLHSCGVNAAHGIRRTNADKHRAVLRLLEDGEWSRWSDREIARRCAVSHNFVNELRRSLSSDDRYESPTDRLVERGGTVYTQDTRRIGARELVLPKAGETGERTSRFNRTNDNIAWAAWTWNPVTGCHHNCEYCYARDIACRFNPAGFEPTFHEDRLAAPANTNPDTASPAGSRVFVCSMADLFGTWVPNEWIFAVLKAVRENPQWTFIFLTKNPRRYASIQFPDNAWIGASVDRQIRVAPTEESLCVTNASVRFVSCEPMLEPLTFGDLRVFDRVIIGARSRTSTGPEFQPELEWVIDLSARALEAGCQVFLKPNLVLRSRGW